MEKLGPATASGGNCFRVCVFGHRATNALIASEAASAQTTSIDDLLDTAAFVYLRHCYGASSPSSSPMQCAHTFVQNVY